MPVKCFAHMPKTGGGSVFDVVVKHPDAINNLSEYWRDPYSRLRTDRINYFQGHIFHDYLEAWELPGEYFTILRDPIDRLHSHYTWLYGGQPEVRSKESFLGWALNCRHLNYYAATFGNRRTMPQFLEDYSQIRWEPRYLAEHYEPNVEEAVRVLEGYRVVGLFTHLEEAMRAILGALGIHAVELPHTHRNAKHFQLDDSLREALLPRMQADYEVYNHFKNLDKQGSMVYTNNRTKEI